MRAARTELPECSTRIMAPPSLRGSRTLQLLRRFGRPHRRWLGFGLAGTLAVVFCRVAMPWPLRGAIELAIAPVSETVLPGLLPDWGTEMLWLGGTYVAIAAALGFSELRQRVCIKTFASHTVHDLRGAAVGAALEQHGQAALTDEADLLSRIVGDSARLKAELSGILVHASQNGLLFLGICLLFLYLSPKLSLFFLAGGVFALWVGYRATQQVGGVAKHQREKEADYAAVVQQALQEGHLTARGHRVNRQSARKEVAATRIIARSTWFCVIPQSRAAWEIGSTAAGSAVAAPSASSSSSDTRVLRVSIAFCS